MQQISERSISRVYNAVETSFSFFLSHDQCLMFEYAATILNVQQRSISLAVFAELSCITRHNFTAAGSNPAGVYLAFHSSQGQFCTDISIYPV